MDNVRPPGVLWVMGLTLVIALIHNFEPEIQKSTGLSAEVLDVVVLGLMAILKTWKPGTEQLEQAISIIEQLKNQLIRPVPPQPDFEGMRGSSTTVFPPAEGADLPLVLPATPPRPNKAVRWLAG